MCPGSRTGDLCSSPWCQGVYSMEGVPFGVFNGSFFSHTVPESGTGSALGGNIKWKYISYPGTCLFLHQLFGVATPDQTRPHTRPPANGSCGAVSLRTEGTRSSNGTLTLWPASVDPASLSRARSDKGERARASLPRRPRLGPSVTVISPVTSQNLCLPP